MPGVGIAPEVYMPTDKPMIYGWHLMTDNPEGSIERLRERLDNNAEEGISDADAEVLLKFSNRLFVLGSRYTAHRHEALLMRLVKMASEVGGLADALEDRDAAEDVVRWIHQYYDNPESNKDRRVALRMLGEHATDAEGKPSSIEWIPTGYHGTYDPTPDPAEMLRFEEDIKPMMDACYNARDKALIALAFDLGPRSGELQSLTIGSLTDHDYGLQVTLNGKTGRRSPVLVPSVPHVNQWLAAHPGGAADDPLWSKITSTESISGTMIRKALREAADRADVTRPVTPTNFRKSSASYLASEGVSQAHLEAHHGWSRGSKVASRYISVFGEAAEREIARAHGVDVSADEPDPTAPLECPRCSRKTPRDEPTCVWCGQAMSQSQLETVREQNAAVRRDTATATGDRAEALAELGDLFDRHPFLREAAGDG